MVFATRGLITLATLATSALLAACGGGDAGSARLTLTDDECTYEGDETPSATETFEVEVSNQGSKLGAFEIARIDAGGTFTDVEAYVESERQRLEEGLQIVGPPAFLTLGARVQVPTGESDTLVSTVTSDQWVLWCAHDHPPTALFLITPPLEISE